ncbi:hypothetical protein [Desulfopila aestuarii]|uniref:Uncharacterized protein n=1 Tax=Desulfopila aestuarii DSM 18488 TaxID=1121416 RepID=A0A1M7XXX1_9BACT|nr:hypothetical protein [Desulfopila aestuarii]SHO43781.1 hypothetical protein SAMN02745220_00511 [Desulfopila aestuarii DSM 18488]
MLRHPEFSVVLFFLCLCIFGWPFISIPGASSLKSMFYYLFISWGIIIVLLFLIGIKQGKSDNHDGNLI